MAASAGDEKHITIVGGGIIGCSAAYYLTRHPSYDPARHHITLLEASSTNDGGRLTDGSSPLEDPASLLPDPSVNPKNPKHAGIAGGASGKAGGLLALWAFPQNLVPLSFRLHEELAQEHGGEARWGYRRCYASQVECKARMPGSLAGSKTTTGDNEAAEKETQPVVQGLHKDHRTAISRNLRKLGAPDDLDWLRADALRSYDGMGTPRDTAQVHPELFTRSLAALAEEKGVTIRTGCAVKTLHKASSSSFDSKIDSVTFTRQGDGSGEEVEETLNTTDLILAAGPWTRNLVPSIPVISSRAHSIVIRTPGPTSVSPYALFTSISLPAGFPSPSSSSSNGKSNTVPSTRPRTVEPEIYARPDRTAYACGPTDTDVPLPPSNSGVTVDPTRCADIEAQVSSISDELGSSSSSSNGGEILARQACYLPQGGPYIGFVDQARSVVVAAGHTCWGIQNGPGTGKLVSELIMEGKAKSGKLGGCDPGVMM